MMRKFLLSLFLGIGFIHLSADIKCPEALPIATYNVESTVLICNSKNAYGYHAYECRGLKQCKASISKVSLSTARKRGRKACGFCY